MLSVLGFGELGFEVNWLAAPARKRGFARWGVKEVRWSGAHGLVLRWLYPKAHFLLIVRDPVSAYGVVIGIKVNELPAPVESPVPAPVMTNNVGS